MSDVVVGRPTWKTCKGCGNSIAHKEVAILGSTPVIVAICPMCDKRRCATCVANGEAGYVQDSRTKVCPRGHDLFKEANA